MDTSSISDINTCSIEKFSVPLTLEYQVLPEIQDHRFLLGVPNDALSSFRAVPGKGLRGFLEGGEFPDSTALSCAQRCIQDPQCLSFDVENKICYVSHTDRYVHPEAFLDFPSGTYYEWQGIVSTLDIEPNGGVYSTQIAIRFFSSRSSGQIHYKIVSSSIPSTNVSLSTEYQVAISGDVIVLPAFSCRVYAVAVKNGIHASEVFISKEFRIFASKYAYLSPYFNGKEFHGKVVRIQLDISGKKRPRPARFFELSDYESLNGIGPYKKQLSVMDLTLYHPNLRGFQGCFTAFSKANYINETYFIDTTTKNNQPNEAEQVTWRLVLEGIFLPHVNQLSTKTISLDAEYLYLVPGFKDNQPLGTIVRILTGTFTATKPTIELLNLTLIDPSLKGFSHGFTDFKYGYFVPFNNGIAPNFLFGKIVRVDLNNFTPQGVQILDLTSQNPFNVGFSHGFQYNGYGYVIPFQRLLDLTVDEKTILRDFPVPTNGRLVRFQLTNFQTIEVLDLTKAHPFLRGFSGCVQVTNYLYLIPYMQIKKIDSKERNPFSGLLGRVDLRNFQTIEYLDLTNIHPDLKGFRQGFHYKKYVF
jgi:hypothetical protein